jgi:tryptophanyl-tRNA synthetase
MTNMGKLTTMTQWKVKKEVSNEQLLGLLAYPVLMTADILLCVRVNT